MLRYTFNVVVGISGIVLGLILGLIALASVVSADSGSGRAMALAIGVAALMLMAVGTRSFRSRIQATASSISGGNGSTSEQYVTVDRNGCIQVNVQTVAEGRIAIKELRLLKKALAVRKREVTSQQKEIRAGYTDHVRRRRSKVVGGGGIGRFIRVLQTVSRDNTRNNLAKSLEPLEGDKQKIEAASNAVDRAIVQMEEFVLRGS